MKISEWVRQVRVGSSSSIVQDAVGQVKSAIAEVYTNSSLRRISHESPFLALGINQGQWESLPANWRKSVRRLWRNTVPARNEVPELADRLNAQLDEFISAVEELPTAEEGDESEPELEEEVSQNLPPSQG